MKQIRFVNEGDSILRKNKQFHIDNECRETVLMCSNEHCKAEIKRQDFYDHVNLECKYRIIKCTFAKYGCDVQQIKACELEQHLNEYQVQHLSHKFEFILNQVRDIQIMCMFLRIYFTYHTICSKIRRLKN